MHAYVSQIVTKKTTNFAFRIRCKAEPGLSMGPTAFQILPPSTLISFSFSFSFLFLMFFFSWGSSFFYIIINMLLFLLYAKLHLEKEKKIFIALLSISFKGSKLIKGKKKGWKKKSRNNKFILHLFCCKCFFF